MKLYFLSMEEKLIGRRYYQPAIKERTNFLKKLFSSWEPFDMVFPEIKNSLIDAGFFRKMYAFIKWKFFIKSEAIPKDEDELNRVLPMTVPRFGVGEDEIKYTWIGHSTAVISFGGDANFLIDPVFSERSSPFQWIGPKRFRPPACRISELPIINAVLVSHDHYDHLDEHALNQLYKKSQNDHEDMHFFAGLRSDDVFPRNAIIHQMDWTDTHELNINGKIFKITFVPVCHWSRRKLFDQNKRLWGGFVIQTPSRQKVFYSGDTGYCGIFKELGEIFQQFDLAILPIGAYQPREFLQNQHINPQEAVKVHKELNAKKSVGVHWGTFPLGNEHFTAARRDLEEAKEEEHMERQDFVAIGHGASLTIPYKESGKQKMKRKVF